MKPLAILGILAGLGLLLASAAEARPGVPKVRPTWDDEERRKIEEAAAQIHNELGEPSITPDHLMRVTIEVVNRVWSGFHWPKIPQNVQLWASGVMPWQRNLFEHAHTTIARIFGMHVT